MKYAKTSTNSPASGLSPFKPVFDEIFIECIGLLKKEIKVFTNITPRTHNSRIVVKS